MDSTQRIGGSLISSEISIPPAGMREFVKGLAEMHGITDEQTYADVWGNAVGRMTGNEVMLDYTQRLLVSLQRAQKITSGQMLTILAQYLKERRVISSA